MANTTTNSALVVTKFLSDFFREFIRNNRFSRYTGTGVNMPVVIKEGEQKIEIPLVTRLTGNGVSGSSTLRGNGESIGNYGHLLTPTYYRHAVEFDREEMDKPAIDLMKAARPLLMNWSMELVRDHVIEALGAVYDGTTYANYGSATAAAMDTWNTNQGSNRILYGTATANYSAGNHTTSLSNVATTETMDKETISLAKRLAKTADPHIRPVKVEGADDEEYFVCFMDPYAFRDLKTDLGTSYQNAMPRSRQNPLFRDGDLIWDGVICREVPEIADFVDGANAKWGALSTADDLSSGGGSSGRIGPCFLVGAQALGFGMGQRPRIIVDRDYDYGFQPGVAVECKHDIDKLFFNNVQHGVVNMFPAAATD